MTINISYDADGRVQNCDLPAREGERSVQSFHGVSTLVYDDAGRVVQVVLPDARWIGPTAAESPKKPGPLTEVQRELGARITFVYAPSWELKGVIQSDGRMEPPSDPPRVS